ncbi:MAG TPA: hypothetical protein VKX39_11975 [Bryobacteraceae bacterium]|jgi:hypothetical protein|nr:hypothetical protein [Bryobacteraceae bacterium]
MSAFWRIALSSFLLASAATAADDGFSEWWPQFQAAVKSGDARAISANSKFPMQWELGSIREVKSRGEFIARFKTLFTADMTRAVAAEKPVQIPEGYMITWQARGNEYSFYFHPAAGGGFALAGLSEGPP